MAVNNPKLRKLYIKAALIILFNIIIVIGLRWVLQKKIHLTVTAIGPDYVAYINGSEATTFNNSTFLQGSVGFAVDYGIGNVSFDNVSITSPDGSTQLLHDRFRQLSFDRWRIVHGQWAVSPASRLVSNGRGQIVTAQSNFNDFKLEFDLFATQKAEILLRSPDGTNGVSIILRPQQDVCWMVISNGRPGIPTNCKAYEEKARITLKEIAEIISRNHWNAVRVGGLSLLGGMMASIILGLLVFWFKSLMASSSPETVEKLSTFIKNNWNEVVRLAESSWVKVFICIVLFCVSFYLLSWIAVDVLEGIPHVQDSISTLFQARVFAANQLWAPAPPFGNYFNFEMIVNRDGKWYTKYQPFHPLFTVPFLLFGKPWLTNPFFGAVALVLIYLLALRVYNHRVGVIAGVLCLTSPFFLLMSASFMSHTTTMFFMALFCYLLAEARARLNWGIAFLAGVALGCAANTRALSSLAVCLPFVVLGMADLLKGMRKPKIYGPVVGVLWMMTGFAIWKAMKGLSTFNIVFLIIVGILHLGAFLFIYNKRYYRVYFCLVAGVAPLIGFVFYYNAVVTGDPLLFPLQAYSGADVLGFGKDVGWLGGHTPTKGLNNILLNLQSLTDILFGWPGTVTLVFLLIPLISLSRNYWDYMFYGSIVCLVTAYFFWWYHGICYGPRFWFEALPMFVILSVRGIERIFEMARSFIKAHEGSQIKIYSLGPVIPYLAMSVYMGYLIHWNTVYYFPSRLQSSYINYNGINASMLRFIRDSGYHNALFVVARSHFWQDWGQVFLGNDPWLQNDVLFVNDFEENRDVLKSILEAYDDRDVFLIKEGQIKEFRWEDVQKATQGMRKMRRDVSPFVGGQGLGKGQFDEPRDVDCGPTGDFFVSDFRNYRVQRFDKQGNFLAKWGSRGRGDNEFEDACGIAVDLNNNVYVADTYNGKVKKFTDEGQHLKSWGALFAPRGIIVDEDNYVYVTNTEMGEIIKYTSEGAIQAVWGQREGAPKLTRPIGVAYSAFNKQVYVSDTTLKKVFRYTRDGEYIADWALDGGNNVDFGECYIDVDSKGNVYVTDTHNHKVKKYGPEGKFLIEWGSHGFGRGNFNQPTGLAIDDEGNIYVSDTWNHRLQKFNVSEFE